MIAAVLWREHAFAFHGIEAAPISVYDPRRSREKDSVRWREKW